MWWQPKTVHEVLAPIFWLNWLFGLGVFEIPTENRQPVLSVAYGLLLAIAYFSMLFGSFSYIINYLEFSSKIVFIPMLCVNITVAAVSVINGWGKVNTLKQVRDKFASLDRTLLKLGMANLYNEAARNIIFYLILWFAVTLLLFITDYFWTAIEFKGMYTFGFTLLSWIPITQNSVVDFTFTIFVRGVLRRVQVLNNLSSETIDYLNVKRYTDFDYSLGFRRVTVEMRICNRNNFIKQYIAAAKNIHLEIVRLSRLVNSAYSTVLLFELAVSFTLIIGCLFNLYLGLARMSITHSVDIVKILMIMSWIVVVCFKVIGINYACSSFDREMNVTAQIIRDFNRLHEDEDLREQIQQFCMQLILHPIHFSAAGFVRLDNDCTRMFFGTVVTYLAILMQASSNPKGVHTLLPAIQ